MPLNRRNFLRMLTLVPGLGLLEACNAQDAPRRLIPQFTPPEDDIPTGEPIFTKSVCTECPAHCGLWVKSYDKVYQGRLGRYPVKLEGLPQDPITQGKLCIRGQASIGRVYHPNRLQAPLLIEGGNERTLGWNEANAHILEALKKAKAERKRNIYLSGRTTGSLRRLLDEAASELGIERLEFELLDYPSLKASNQLLFGKPVLARYRIDEADFLLSLGADLLETFGNPVENALQITKAKERGGFFWTHAEPALSLTGLNADVRLQLRPGSEPFLLVYLLRALFGPLDAALPSLGLEQVTGATGLPTDRVERLVEGFKAAKAPLVVVGGASVMQEEGLAVGVLAGLLNIQTGSLGKRMDLQAQKEKEPQGSLEDLARLSQDLKDGRVGVLFVSRCDPWGVLQYGLEGSTQKARLVVSLVMARNETQKMGGLWLPLAHTLESWGDVQTNENLVRLFEPAMAPLFESRSEGDVLLGLLSASGTEGHPLSFKDYLKKRHGNRFEPLLREGFLIEKGEKSVGSLDTARVASFVQDLRLTQPRAQETLFLSPSLRFHDGRSADLALLHEIPDPVTTVSYGPFLLSPKETLGQEGLEEGEEVEVEAEGISLRVPVKTHPELTSGSYVLVLGYTSIVALGWDQETKQALGQARGVRIKKTGRRRELPILAGAESDYERPLLERPKPHPSLYPEHAHKPYRWAMAIDTDLCTGCSACVAACYIENNVPITGPKEHIRGREMSWIRIETHDIPSTRGGVRGFLPMLCQHCDNAPCEPVCPVYATYHNPEGLNAQVYNRCVGTRYCSNNCPYKVRRFNWFDHEHPKEEALQLNPEVFVRGRGVMEKCTFCIQRIRAAKDKAKDEDRFLKDGEVVPACAQSCPSKAIVFGNILDESSEVAAWARSKRAFRFLEELGTEPSVYYLAKGNDKKDV